MRAESTLIKQTSKRSNISSANSVFPEAVGPIKKTTESLDDILIRILGLFHLDLHYNVSFVYLAPKQCLLY